MQEVARAGGSKVVSNILWQGVMPQVAVVMVSFVLALVVGLVVGSKLPRAESMQKRGSRRKQA